MAPSSPPGLCPDPLTHALPRPTAGVSIWWFRSLGCMPVFRLTLTHPTLAPGNPGTSPRTPLWWVPPCPCWQPSWSASKSAPLPASRTPAAPRTQLLCPEKRTEHSQPRDGLSLSVTPSSLQPDSLSCPRGFWKCIGYQFVVPTQLPETHSTFPGWTPHRALSGPTHPTNNSIFGSLPHLLPSCPSFQLLRGWRWVVGGSQNPRCVHSLACGLAPHLDGSLC